MPVNDESGAVTRARLGQILSYLEECRTGLAAVKDALDGAAEQIRAAAEGSHRHEAAEAVTALVRSRDGTDGVLDEIASAAAQAREYRKLV